MDGVETRTGADDDTATERVSGRPSCERQGVYAVNSRYAACSQDDEIIIRDFKSNAQWSLRLGHGSVHSRLEPALALSSARLSLLAVAAGTHILIYDIEARRTHCELKGNGHIVTGICFPRNDETTLASGTADGSICIWSLKQPSRTTHQVRGGTGPCANVSISHNNTRAVASVHEGRLSIWLFPSSRPKAIATFDSTELELLSWCPENNGCILALTSSGILRVCNARGAIANDAPQPAFENEQGVLENEDGSIAEELEGLEMPAFSHALGYQVKQAQLFGHHGIVVFPQSARTIHFYSYSLDAGEPTELWRLSVGAAVECFTLRTCKASVEILTCSQELSSKFDVPTPVLDGMGWTYGRSLQWLPVLEPAATGEQRSPKLSILPSKLSMRKSSKRQKDAAFNREIASNLPRRYKKHKYKKSLKASMNAHHEPDSKSNVDSLELPRVAPAEDDSPMPFLSPTIPSRKVSPGSITPLDELVQLPQPSFDSMSSAATQGHESDSDDETFAPHMQGSGTLLPGGVNVPLPRTCGACFGANGRLITFFSIRIRTSAAPGDTRRRGEQPESMHGREISRLFPTFGNLGPTNKHYLDNDLESLDSADAEIDAIPQFAIQAASFDSRPSWSARVSPIKPEAGATPGQQGVNVTTYNLEDLGPTRRNLAEHYEVVFRDREVESNTCRSNADGAEGEELKETALAWRLLALMLEQYKLQLPRDGEVAQLLTGRPELSRNVSTVSGMSAVSFDAGIASNADASGPLSGTWAIEQLFSWAERRADIQLLASMSAVIVQSSSLSQADSHPTASSDHRSYFTNGTPEEDNKSQHRVAFLRTDSSGSRFRDDSFIKPLGSRGSSRNTSQPTTPYLDSSTSSPPMTLPVFSRQPSTGLSQTGSASPEHHRSSFSAAARNYAASIAEKFGSYGSSPPTKKFGTSPSDLPSSLPSGSLSKSVSFASGINGVSSGRRSLSFAQEDDKYESDRTIDDTSLPHTPRGQNSGIILTVKQHDFFDETSARPCSLALSKSLAIKCSIWRRYYAEMLRSWDLPLIGAEMEYITDRSGARSRSKSPVKAVVPFPKDSKRTTCAICFCLIQAAQQICPQCLHTSHPACLEDLITASADNSFACPAGCGCDCSAVAGEVQYAMEEEASMPLEANPSLPSRERPKLADLPSLRHRLEDEM